MAATPSLPRTSSEVSPLEPSPVVRANTYAIPIRTTMLGLLDWIWAARLDGDKRAQFRKALLPGAAAFFGVFAACTLVAGASLGWIPATLPWHFSWPLALASVFLLLVKPNP